MDYVMRRHSTVGGALEMFSLPLLLGSGVRVIASFQIFFGVISGRNISGGYGFLQYTHTFTPAS